MKILLSITIFLLTWLIFYLIGGVVPFDWNINNWGYDGRIAYVVFSTGMGSLFIGIYLFCSKTKNN